MSLTLPDDAADWAEVWRDRINDRDEFASAAADFSATFRFEIQADETYGGDAVAFRVGIEDGTCTDATLATEPAYDFALRGPYAAWKELLEGELDVSESVMNGTFDLEGNTMTLLQRQDAVAEMVAAARNVETEFAY